MELTLNLGGPPCKELSSSIDDTSSLVQPDRRMRKHTKSRRACANCRLRRVKCDETKPGCQKCETFGVVCTYDRGDEKLQVLVKGMLAPEELKIQLPPSSESQMILNIINAPRDMPRATSMSMLLDTVNLDPIDHFSLKDLELLKNWHSKTMPTLAAADWKHVYENAYTKLTFSVSSTLAYCMLRFTTDQCLASISLPRRSDCDSHARALSEPAEWKSGDDHAIPLGTCCRSDESEAALRTCT